VKKFKSNFKLLFISIVVLAIGAVFSIISCAKVPTKYTENKMEPQKASVEISNIDFKFFLWVILVFAFVWVISRIRRTSLTKHEKIKTYAGYYVRSKSGKLVHRWVAEKYLGRKLYPNEIVHHINGIRDDNSLWNLCVMDREKHEHFHAWLKWQKEKNGFYPQPNHRYFQ